MLSSLNAVISTNEKNWILSDRVIFKLRYNQINQLKTNYIFMLSIKNWSFANMLNFLCVSVSLVRRNLRWLDRNLKHKNWAFQFWITQYIIKWTKIPQVFCYLAIQSSQQICSNKSHFKCKLNWGKRRLRDWREKRHITTIILFTQSTWKE